MKLPKLRQRIAETVDALKRAEEQGNDRIVDTLFSYLLAFSGLNKAKHRTKSPRRF